MFFFKVEPEDLHPGQPPSADVAKKSCVLRSQAHLAESAAASPEDPWSLSKHFDFSSCCCV